MAATPQDPEDALRAAEAAHLAARDTVPIRSGAAGRPRAADGRRSPRPEPDDAGPQPAGGRAAPAGGQRDTVRLPRQRPGGTGGSGRPGRRQAPLVLASGVATGWAALISAAPVVLALVLARMVEHGGSPGGAIRAGLAGWLLGHGVPLQTGTGRLALVPLGLTALAAWRVMRAGVHTTRGIRARRTGSPRHALAVAGAVAVWYALFGGLAALIVGDGGSPGVSVPRATATLAAFGALFGLAGAAGATGALDTVSRRLPSTVRDGVRTGVVVALLLLGSAAAAAGISLALGGGEAAEVFGAYRTGVAGQAGITLICIAYGPNGAAWAAAYLIGPGFTVGTDTMVRVTDVSVGGLPAIPVFAGLPAGPLGAVGAALLCVPVVVAMTGGWLLVRRRAGDAPQQRSARRARGTAGRYRGTAEARPPASPPGLSWPSLLGVAGVAGPVAGLLLGAAALISSGSLGGGRLSRLGPVPWQVAAIATLVVTVGTAVGAVAARTTRTPG